MSGIVGIWHLDGRPADHREIARLLVTLRHRGRDAEAVRVDGTAALGSCLARTTPESASEIQPAVADDGTMLVFDGRIDDRDELIAALASRIRVPTEASDSTLALAAYRAFGNDFPVRLTGDFALGLFDARRRRMILARDGVGGRPLYYFATARLFLFASEIKAIVSHPSAEARPDDGALADFLFTRGIGREPTERTFFEGVASVLPAHAVIAEPRGVRPMRYWDFDVTRRMTFAREAEYAEAFKQHFDRAVRRRLRARPAAVSVSGGLDSSAVFCAAHALARHERNGLAAPIGVSLTFPDGAPSDEKQYLAAIEHASGVAIVRLHDPPIGMSNRCEDAVWHAEGPWLDGQWNATHAQMSAVRDLGAAVLLTGHWGDQFLFDDAYLVDLCRSGRWQTALRHATTYSRWMDVPEGVFKRRLAAALLKYHAPDVAAVCRRVRDAVRRRPAARAWYTDEFARRARPAARRRRPIEGTAHARSLYAEIRSQYAVSCMEWNNKIAAMHGLDIAFPFLDRDLVGFLMAIPGEMVTRAGVPKALLRDGYRGVIPEAIIHRSSKADFTDRANAGLTTDRSIALDGIRNGLSVERRYVRRQAFDAIAALPLDDASSVVNARALTDLFALEVWLREFVGPNRRSQQGRMFEHAQAI
jgi:asparagine synthase (glutamine-hydrolysing)